MNRACEKYCGLIEDLIEGEEIDEQTAALIELHVLGCAGCRREYELLRREKEILAHYMFDFEPPPNSLANFQARLIEEDELSARDAVSSANLLRPRQRIFSFGFSPVWVAFAGLFLFFGIGFVLLRNAEFEKNDERYIAETKSEVSQPSSPQSSETNQKPETELQAGKDAAKNDWSRVGVQSLKERSSRLFSKKFLATETVKIKQKIVSSSERKKTVTDAAAANDESRAATLRKQNLEMEIAWQIEKIELLLRSFRNVQVNEAAESFDVEYEKRQARKLLDQNAQLKRNTENYEISYAEELLSRAEPYLLDIANLETNPAPDSVLDIKERLGSQNIIASLQVYNVVAAQ